MSGADVEAAVAGEPAPADASYDDSGVDRSQIRQLLALTPDQRLERLQQHVRAVLRIRALNAPSTPHAKR